MDIQIQVHVQGIQVHVHSLPFQILNNKFRDHEMFLFVKQTVCDNEREITVLEYFVNFHLSVAPLIITTTPV